MERIYWYNQKTGEVEVGPQSISLDRIGPFETLDEAKRAPELIAEKARRLREEDREKDEWN